MLKFILFEIVLFRGFVLFVSQYWSALNRAYCDTEPEAWSDDLYSASSKVN